jgi:DNA-directed RNA polymerase specialized sigma24 family protein
MNKNKAVNEWQIDVFKVLQNDQVAITNFYNTIQPYFLWLFKGDEDLFHKLFMNVLSSIHTYDFTKGAFHNWLIKSAYVLKKEEQTKQKRQPIKYVAELPELHLEDAVPLCDEWKDELKADMYQRLERLRPPEKEFIIEYIESPEAKNTQQRKKFQRLKEKLIVKP